MEAENQEQEVDLSKIEKKFKQAVTRLAAVVGGTDKLIVSKKVPAGDMDLIVSELFAEEKKKNYEDAKVALKDVLSKYATFCQEVQAKEQEFEKIKNQKMEEFTKAANAALNKLAGVDQREKLYLEGLTKAVGKKDDAG